MKPQLALLVVCSALTNAIVPSTNIFTPSWLVQRRARHLTPQSSYIVPQVQPQTLYYANSIPGYTTRNVPFVQPTYYMQPTAYSPTVLAPIDITQRTFYQAPVYTHFLTAPVSNFAKRLDSVPAKAEE